MIFNTVFAAASSASCSHPMARSDTLRRAARSPASTSGCFIHRESVLTLTPTRAPRPRCFYGKVELRSPVPSFDRTSFRDLAWTRRPVDFTPFTRLIPCASSGASRPLSAASAATLPSHLCTLAATDENAPPKDAQLSRITWNSMVLVIAQHNLPEPFTDLAATVMLPALKCSLDGFQLRDHPLLSRNPPDDESFVAAVPSTETSETQVQPGASRRESYPLADGPSDGEAER
jgi:hypothetical protein